MSDVVHLNGAPVRMGPAKRPQPKFVERDRNVTELRRLVTPNDCMLLVEAEMRRLLNVLGGDQDEWMDRIEDICRKVMGRD